MNQPNPLPPPASNYLAKDYESFRQAILDHLSLLVPGWHERLAADLGITLVELLAYAGDYLSYYQDAVGAEAYLHTARRRVSVRRHARLLDYAIGEGCNARAWVQLATSANECAIPAGTPLLPRQSSFGVVVPPQAAPGWPGPVFETLHPAVLRAEQNLMVADDGGNPDSLLPAGTCHATLLGHFPHLDHGDVLIVEQAAAGDAGLANPPSPQAVRLSAKPVLGESRGRKTTAIEWMREDALLAPFVLSTRSSTGRLLTRQCAFLGNIVLAAHGRSGVLTLPEVPFERPYTPPTGITGLTHGVPYSHHTACRLPAKAAIEQDQAKAEAWIELHEFDPSRPLALGLPRTGLGPRWTARRDLLAGNRFSRDFVVEIDNDGEAHLRFGDGLHGRAPSPGRAFLATYRQGQGVAGNIGPATLAHIAAVDLPITSVRNPLPATGGQDPETIEQVRIAAPHAFREQRRCVLPSDYEDAARSFPGVAAVSADRVWVDNAAQVNLYVQRAAHLPVDEPFARALATYLEPLRLIGDTLHVRAASSLPVSVAADVFVATGWMESVVLDAIRLAMARFLEACSLGQPLYLSELVAVASAVPGVAGLRTQISTAQAASGQPAAGQPAPSAVFPAAHELIRLDTLLVQPARDARAQGQATP